MLPLSIIALTAASFLSVVAGHAGSHSEAEIQAELQLRSIVTQHSRRALDRCADSSTTQALRERAVARRVAAAHAIRVKRGLQNENVLTRRDRSSFQQWSALSHESNQDYSLDTSTSTIFASNTTCALVPETVIGPYYVDGELIRTDITDSQSGIPVHLDIQFIDQSTCSTVTSSLLIDIWHCNSTGVYSGVSAPGQGGLKTTHGRGAQETDSDGVVQFDTLFPGHYTGRATHIHLMATAEATILPNKTFTGGTARHIGQLYFDQDLRDEVEKLEPYVSNKQSVTSNNRDGIAPDQATEEYDPFLNYVLLGDKLEDGLLMWITIGLDLEADYSGKVQAAAHFEGNEETGVTKTGGGGETLASTSLLVSSSNAAAGRIGVMRW